MATPMTIVEPEEDTTALSEQERVLAQIQSCWSEAKGGREGGEKPRDTAWTENWKAYWADYDYSNKEEWQSRQKLPDFGNFVDRFAAMMKLAWRQTPAPFEIGDSLDPDRRVAKLVQKGLRIFLDRSGTNASGQYTGFGTCFGDCMHAGAMMNAALSITWEDGRLRIDPVDPREVYYDPSGRRHYRIRHYEIDKWELIEKAKKDPDVWDLEAIRGLTGATGEPTEDKQESSESSMEVSATGRTVIQIHEYLGVILDADGEATEEGTHQLAVMADERVLIRGPERNPMAHGKDWIVYAPLLRVPFSVYHKTYAENFKELAAAFLELTNLISDAVYTATMPQYQGWADALLDPNQMKEGQHPNKIWWTDTEIVEPGKRFIMSLDPPKIDMAAAVTVWQGTKQEMREAASQNELNLGQLARGEKTATEIDEAAGGRTTLVSAIADSIDEGLLTPMLELSWMTIVQHLTDNEDDEAATDAEILAELGPEIANMIVSQRDEFLRRRFRFNAKAIRGTIERAQRIRSLIAAVNVIGSNPELAQAFARRYSLDRLVDVILTDNSVDTERLEKTDEEREQDLVSQMVAARGRTAKEGGPADPISALIGGMPGPTGAPAK